MWVCTSITEEIVSHSFANINYTRKDVFLMSNSESFRNELAARLFDKIPQDQLAGVLSVLDATLSGYDVSRKQVELIQTDGIPEAVKYFLTSKAIGNLSPGTLKIYRLRLIDFFKAVRKPFSDVDANDIRRYMFACKTDRSNSDAYLDNIRRILHSFFSWCVDNGYLLRNPCSTVERVKYQPKEREPLTAYQLETLRWHCKTLREKAMVDFFYSTGVRLAEFSAVRKSDIDWSEHSVIIRHGKGNKRRVVFFNAEAEVSLRKYLESRTDDCDALFVTLRRPFRPIGPKAVENAIKKVADRANLHAFPHKLRHTFATSGLQGGMSLEDLQALMGHSKPETTLIYAKIDMSELQYAHRRTFL